MDGLAWGIVKENHDNDHPGMLKISLPTLAADGDETFWARVMAPYAGKGYGLYFLPEVGDSVIVGWILGDPCAPVVLGGYWNSVNTFPTDAVTEENTIKTLTTKGGHKIQFTDGDEGGLTVKTKAGHVITLSDKEKKMTVATADGKNTVTLNEDASSVEVVSGGKLSLKAEDIAITGKMTLKGSDITIEADSGLTLKGKTVKLDGTSTKINGQTVEVTGSTSAKIESSAMLTLKGSMTKIN